MGFEEHCVYFADNALDPADAQGWQRAAAKCDWGDASNDGVSENVNAFATLIADTRFVQTPSHLAERGGSAGKFMRRAVARSPVESPLLIKVVKVVSSVTTIAAVYAA